MKSRVAHPTLGMVEGDDGVRVWVVVAVAHDIHCQTAACVVAYACSRNVDATRRQGKRVHRVRVNGVGGVALVTSSSARTCALLNVPPTMTRNTENSSHVAISSRNFFISVFLTCNFFFFFSMRSRVSRSRLR